MRSAARTSARCGGLRTGFAGPRAAPAQVLALRTGRRSGGVLLAASRRVASRLPAAPGADNLAAQRGHRALVPLPDADPGTVRVVIAASATQEAALIADTLRRAHLIDGVSWSSMAVLVRSASRQVPLLQRVLAAAGVPVAVAGDELPLAAEPGTRPLLTLLGCALRPGALDEQTAAELLTGPFGGTDALGLRRLRRVLRAAAQAAGSCRHPSRWPGCCVIRGSWPWPGGQPAGGRRSRRCWPGRCWPGRCWPGRCWPGRGLGAGRGGTRGAAGRGTAGAGQAGRHRRERARRALGGLDASGLAAQWQQASAAGGSRGAAADADLDAMVALFDAAARFTARLPQGSPRLFLDSLAGQEIAGDTLAQRARRATPWPS